MKRNLLFIACVCIISSAFGQTMTFTDRSAWEALAGTPCFTEDLESFDSDVIFRTSGPLQLNGFTIEQQGNNANFRNMVETPPFMFSDNNGTKHLSLFTNADPDPGTTLVLTFDQPISAFYAEYVSPVGAEVLMEVYNTDMGMLDTYTFQMSNENRGIILDNPNMPITSIVLRSATVIPGTIGEGFSMDNIAMVCAEIDTRPLPMMKNWQLLGLLLILFGVSILLIRRF